VAAYLGWVACKCGETDGTVACPHRKPWHMIADAQEFLDNHLGESFKDPGYFSEVCYDEGRSGRCL
jgi:hypothetical protein